MTPLVLLSFCFMATWQGSGLSGIFIPSDDDETDPFPSIAVPSQSTYPNNNPFDYNPVNNLSQTTPPNNHPQENNGFPSYDNLSNGEEESKANDNTGDMVIEEPQPPVVSCLFVFHALSLHTIFIFFKYSVI